MADGSKIAGTVTGTLVALLNLVLLSLPLIEIYQKLTRPAPLPLRVTLFGHDLRYDTIQIINRSNAAIEILKIDATGSQDCGPGSGLPTGVGPGATYRAKRSCDIKKLKLTTSLGEQTYTFK